MKTLQIDLNNEDVNNIEFILQKISEAINDGFTTGVEFPVNWQIKSKEQTKMQYMQ